LPNTTPIRIAQNASPVDRLGFIARVTALLLLLNVAGCAVANSIVLYPAYGSGDTSVLEGRVIAAEQVRAPSSEDGRWDNLRRNLGLLINKERKRVAVSARLDDSEWQAETDAEGYFRIDLDQLRRHEPGWHRIGGKIEGSSSETGLLIVPPGNVSGLISDFDDTIIVTEVNSTRRMLANTLLRNPLQRQAVPGTAALYRELAARNPLPEAAPIFYLSASPRQLHFAIETFLGHNGFPPGILVTKRVTNDDTSEPLLDQIAYKTAKIEEILARLPQVQFTLIGDDGESDPEVYEAIRAKYPDRIDAIWIRRVNSDPKRAVFASQGDLQELLSASNPRSCRAPASSSSSPAPPRATCTSSRPTGTASSARPASASP
jgi:phosphatidate phosphatase APP1